MELKRQSIKLPVNNFDALTRNSNCSERLKRHGRLLPESIRAVFCGPSNCGKTNALLSLLTHPNGLRFDNVYLYSKSLNQPKYKFLEKVIGPIQGVQYLPFSEHSLVISPDEACGNSIMIFDDISCEKQDHVKAYYSMGRHKDVDCFYLCQSYAQIPKHLIRDNVNFLAIFRQDEMNLKHIYTDHVHTDMTYEDFKSLCSTCWNDNKYAFLVIDRDRELNNGRYRKGFDCFIIINKCNSITS